MVICSSVSVKRFLIALDAVSSSFMMKRQKPLRTSEYFGCLGRLFTGGYLFEILTLWDLHGFVVWGGVPCLRLQCYPPHRALWRSTRGIPARRRLCHIICLYRILHICGIQHAALWCVVRLTLARFAAVLCVRLVQCFGDKV